jgi:hypothetical protein
MRSFLWPTLMANSGCAASLPIHGRIPNWSSSAYSRQGLPP